MVTSNELTGWGDWGTVIELGSGTPSDTVPLKNLFTDRMGYNLDNTLINIWIERSYRQDILLYVMGYISDKLLFESGYYHKHSGCVISFR